MRKKLIVSAMFGMLLAVILSCPVGWAIATEERPEPMLQPPLPQVAVNTPPAKQVKQKAVNPSNPVKQVIPAQTVQKGVSGAQPVPTQQAMSVPVQSGVVAGAAAPVPAGQANMLAPQQPVYTDMATPQPPATAQVVPPEESMPLESVLKQRSPYLSSGYLFKLFSVLAFLLLGFYLISRFFLSKMMADQRPIGLSGSYPQKHQAAINGAAGGSVWENLVYSLSGGTVQNSMIPRVLSRQRLSPGKELHVVQIYDKILVLASTASSISVIYEITPQVEETEAVTAKPKPSIKISGDPQIHKKYLTRKMVANKTKPAVPADEALGKSEEVYLLEDYEEHFEKNAP